MGLCSSSPTEGTSKHNKPPLTIPAEFIPAISGAPLFKQVESGDQLDHLACYFTHRTYQPGEIVSEMGSTDQVLHLIAGGHAVVYVQKTILATLGVNDYFGEISLVKENTVSFMLCILFYVFVYSSRREEKEIKDCTFPAQEKIRIYSLICVAHLNIFLNAELFSFFFLFLLSFTTTNNSGHFC